MRKILILLTAGLLLTGLRTPPAASQTSTGGGLFQPLNGTKPVQRVLDTRSGVGGRLGAVAPGGTVTFPVGQPNTSGQPGSAVLDVTVPGNAPAGSLSVYPSGTGWDRRVTMTLAGGGTIAQQLTVRLGADGGVTIRNNSAKAVHLVVELHGFHGPGTPTDPGALVSLNSRILDTRGGTPLAPGHKLTLALPGRGGIPAGGASAVILNVAVLGARANGLLGITDSAGRDMTPHIRFAGNQTMQTERVVELGSGGTLTFSQSSTAAVQLVLDLVGYFLPGAIYSDNGGAYIPTGVTPLNFGKRIVLRGRTPTLVGVPVRQEAISYNIVVSTDRPGQPALFGLYNSERSDWNGSPTVTSSPTLQPTELTVYTIAANTFVLRNLFDAPETWVHAYLTGYYSRDFTLP